MVYNDRITVEGDISMVGYVFKRYELKYLLSGRQYAEIASAVSEHLCPDKYGETTIQSLYYDTNDFRLVRASIEKPIYKEKLRLRCYGLNDSNKDVYLEMKRKYDGVVYKRRIASKEQEIQDIFAGNAPDSQIGREIGYFLSFYPTLSPKVMILYDRSAWLDTATDLRITFDRNVRFRTDGLDCHTSLDGTQLLPPDTVLMECKSGTAFPLWLTHLLCREEIVKTSFSKYGAVYERLHRTDNSYIKGAFSYV